TDTSGTKQTVRHYADTSDNPTWVTQGTTTQRYAELIGGDLSLTVNQSASADLTLANPHGDVVATVDLPTTLTPATSITGWNGYDEYGNAAATNATLTGAVDYGWLGTKQRATSGAGLTLMGVRLYNPATGLFTSTDPVDGGNPNAYTYPTDPINSFDLDGRFGWKKFFRSVANVASTISTYASYVPFCSACSAFSAGMGLFSAGMYAASGDYKKAARQLVSTAVGLAMGGAKLGRVAYKFRKVGRYKRAYRGMRKFVGRGGALGGFDRAARGAGRGRGYRVYWGLKGHVAGIGMSHLIENGHFRSQRHRRYRS
ncbi:MAG: hypothetical protein QOH84_2199, partial [Kribbellaceae bacterium]|nr:hypothetical protein [Kribbellaceae bacterium]